MLRSLDSVVYFIFDLLLYQNLTKAGIKLSRNSTKTEHSIDCQKINSCLSHLSIVSMDNSNTLWFTILFRSHFKYNLNS